MAAISTRRDFIKHATLGAIAGSAMALGSSVAFAEDENGTISSTGNTTLRGDTSEKYQAIYDVLILGAGGAGMSAAVEAARAGAKVGVIEAMPNYYEANSSLCAGMVWGWNSHVQLEYGLEEVSREECLAYLETCGGGHEDPAISEVLVDEADEQVEWLEEMGVEFPVDLITTFGAEYNFADKFEPRPHTLTNARETGRGITDALYQTACDLGVEFVFDAGGTNLITDPDGRVVGVVTPKGSFRGNKGVILATSGFSKNTELVNGFIPDLAGSCAGSSSVGSGIIMGASVGAKINNMWCMQAFSVGTLLKSGIAICNLVSAVNRPNVEVGLDGLRHYDEGMYYEDKYNSVIDQDGKVMWSVWDQSITDLGAGHMFAPPCSDGCEAEIADGVVVKADTFEELADAMGVDADAFVSTMNRYNEMAEAGVDEDFGRITNLAPVSQAPYYAAQIVPVTCDSAGGLVITTDSEVLNWSGDKIPGLYAAGSTTQGWRGDTYPGCGTAVTNAIIFGRHAALAAVAEDGSAYEGQLADDAGSYLETDQTEIETAEGEYVGVGQGMGGELQVKITVDGSTITNVEIVSENETEGIGSRAVDALPAEILEAQTYDVDNVSGATVTSTAIRDAVKDAMEQAGLL